MAPAGKAANPPAPVEVVLIFILTSALTLERFQAITYLTAWGQINLWETMRTSHFSKLWIVKKLEGIDLRNVHHSTHQYPASHPRFSQSSHKFCTKAGQDRKRKKLSFWKSDTLIMLWYNQAYVQYQAMQKSR